jgi:hypothetical protein
MFLTCKLRFWLTELTSLLSFLLKIHLNINTEKKKKAFDLGEFLESFSAFQSCYFLTQGNISRTILEPCWATLWMYLLSFFHLMGGGVCQFLAVWAFLVIWSLDKQLCPVCDPIFIRLLAKHCQFIGAFYPHPKYSYIRSMNILIQHSRN